MKNPSWKIEENGKNYLLMFCEKNTICKLCLESYNTILDFEKNVTEHNKLTWFVSFKRIYSNTCGIRKNLLHSSNYYELLWKWKRHKKR